MTSSATYHGEGHGHGDSDSEREVTAAGQAMHALARRLWPINRSITGPGLRQTLHALSEGLPGLSMIEIPSGTHVLDWRVPPEWRVREAWLQGPDGSRVLDFAHSNLHLLGYSMGVDQSLSLAELQAHLHSLPEQPDAIPYVTSYYQKRWGFCLSHRLRQSLPEGQYRAFIDAEHVPGSLSLAELLIPGQSQEEIFLSTYCCHPSMANNELSGPCLLNQLGQWLLALPTRRYSYRLVFLPEMIGSIAYLSLRLKQLQQRVIAGFNLSCVGDERAYSFLPSRAGNTLADRVALHALAHTAPDFQRYHWRDRGSDESNYCAPGVDLPIASVMRSKYGTYPEYHTSLDDLERVVTAQGLAQSYRLYQRMLTALERNVRPRCLVLGEPQLGRRGLYPSLSQKGSTRDVRQLLDLLSYSDGKLDLIAIAQACACPIWELYPWLDRCRQEQLLACD